MISEICGEDTEMIQKYFFVKLNSHVPEVRTANIIFSKNESYARLVLICPENDCLKNRKLSLQVFKTFLYARFATVS